VRIQRKKTEKMNGKKKDGSELGKKEDEVIPLKALLKNADVLTLVDEDSEDSVYEDYLPTQMKLILRIMQLPIEDLKEEVAIREGEKSILHYAAANNFPFVAIVRLIEAIGIDAQNEAGETAIMLLAREDSYNIDLLNELACMKADLSVVNSDNKNIFELIMMNPNLSWEDKVGVISVLTMHGITSINIVKGFRSTLHEFVHIVEPKRLAEEEDVIRFYFRVMSLTDEQLKVEAKELNEEGEHPLLIATAWKGMASAIERLHQAWPSAIDAQNNEGYTAILEAVYYGNINSVDILATMGADLSLKNDHGLNVSDMDGITSNNIPLRFQSELYYESKYYDGNVLEQRWIERRVFMMCLDRVFNWSLANQIESERLMTLPTDVSSVGLFVAHCCINVDASSVSNGIARLIMQFAFGFDQERKRLVGMPREGAPCHRILT
jgi:ankyrin repeat protein